MSKTDKELGIIKAADQKRIDPEIKIKKHPKKKEYPPHWEITEYGIYPSKLLRSDKSWTHIKTPYNGSKTLFTYQHSEDRKQIDEYLKNNNLDDALDIYEKHHPETKGWPIRFAFSHNQRMKTKRQVLN